MPVLQKKALFSAFIICQVLRIIQNYMEVSPAKSLILSATIHGGSYFFIQPRICDATSPAHLRERAIFQACLIKMAFSWKCIGRQQLLFYTTAGMVSGRFILGISFSTWDLRCNIKSSVASQNSKSIRRIILSITLKQNAPGAQLLSALKNLYHNNSFTINRL